MKRFKFSFKALRRIILQWFMLIVLGAGLLSAILLMTAYFCGLNMRIGENGLRLIAVTIITCVITGVIISIPISQLILNPIRSLSDAIEKVTEGDFSVRVDVKKGPSEFKELYESFNKMVSALGENEMFSRDFINNFSHEFKTPIVSIRGFALQLEKDKELDSATRSKYISIIVGESERLTNMANNVLLLSKLENQIYVTNENEIMLDEQLRQCLLILEKSWSAKNIELDVELEECRYRCDDEMLRRMWINLLSNAVKFTPNGGKICVYLKKELNYIKVTIKDNGIGMNKEQLARAFDKFYQADSSHATIGNGLGLALVKRIVELCEAKMTVKSEPGKGTCFEISLPLETEIYSVT